MSRDSEPDVPSAAVSDSDTSPPSGTAKAVDTPSRENPTCILDQESILAILSKKWSCDLDEVRSRLATWLEANPDPNSIDRERNSRRATEKDARLTHIDLSKRWERQVTMTTKPGPVDVDVEQWWEPDDRAAGGILPLRHASVRTGRSVAEGGTDGLGRAGDEPSPIPADAVRF